MGEAIRKILITILILLLLVGVWSVLRACTTVPTGFDQAVPEAAYTEEEKVLKALALSYFVYGCEGADRKVGTVAELIENNEMGILIENAGINRADQADPKTAEFDSTAYILNEIGNYRFLTDVKNEMSGFYGAAFCDDENRCVWISYAGSVTFIDSVACVLFEIVPWFSTQEKSAFELFETVLNCSEVKNQGYSVLLTGHSLGGALATEMSVVNGCEAVTINGADGIAISKMSAIMNDTLVNNNVSSYITSVKGEELSFMRIVQSLMFLGDYKTVDLHLFKPNGLTDPHSAFSFIGCEDGTFYIPEEIKAE